MIKFKILRAPDGKGGGAASQGGQGAGSPGKPVEDAPPPVPEGYTDAGADIDALVSGDGGAPRPDPAPPAKLQDEPDGGGDPEPGKTPDPADPPAPFVPKKSAPKRDVANLRTAYEQTKVEKEALSTKVKELEDQLKKTRDADDRAALLDRITNLEKERGELDSEVKLTRFERSHEYRDQYIKPLAGAFEGVLADLQEITVTADDGSERPAKKEDFDVLLSLDLRKATEKATELFGPVGPQMMVHRNNIRRLQAAARKAVEDQKANSEKFEGERRQKTAEEIERRRKLWDETTKDLTTRFEAWYAPDEKADPEGTKALQKNLGLFDALMNQNSGLTPEQRVKVAASLRLKAGAFDRMAIRYNTAMKRIEELESALEEYETSGEGGQKGGGGDGGGGAGSHMPAGYREAADEIDELSRAR